jgi:peptidyl-prolyl cis-trans isomerase D
VIVRVTTIEPRTVVTFEEAKEDLKKEIATRNAAAEISDTHDAIEDARAGGETISEIAPRYGLSLASIEAIDSTGKDRAGTDVPNLPAKDQLIAGIFETDVGNENDPLRTVDNGYVWYEVTGVAPARDRPLDEVKDRVIAAWKEAERDKRLAAKANEIVARIKAGEGMVKVASDVGLEVKTGDAITRGTQPSGDLSADVIDAAFSGPVGTAGEATGATKGTRVVFVVTDRTVPLYFSGTPDLTETKDQMVGQLTNNLLQFYVAELQRNLNVSINQNAIQQVLGLPGS